MTDAPERIIISGNPVAVRLPPDQRRWEGTPISGDLEYVHTDLLDAIRREARNEALEEAFSFRDKLIAEIGCKPYSSIHSALCEYAKAIKHLKDKE